MKAILPLSYFGSIQYFAILKRAESVVIDTHEHFIKQTYRNRTEILGANGKLALTVPVKRRDKTPMHKVKISDSNEWQKQHWKSIEAAYRSSPYFEYYEHKISPFFQNEYDNLVTLNKGVLDAILGILNIEVELNYSDSYIQEYANANDYRLLLTPKSKLEEYYPDEEYIQVFSDRFSFEPNLSILDLIFNEGPNAVNLL